QLDPVGVDPWLSPVAYRRRLLPVLLLREAEAERVSADTFDHPFLAELVRRSGEREPCHPTSFSFLVAAISKPALAQDCWRAPACEKVSQLVATTDPIDLSIVVCV